MAFTSVSTPAPSPAPPASGVPGAEVLDRLEAVSRAKQDNARAELQLVVAWAAAHPAPGVEPLPAHQMYADRLVELAGPGAPSVSEFGLVDMAARMGKSAAAGKRFASDALELGFRLPRIWARIEAGELDAIPAQRIAQRTKELSLSAAAWVDAKVARRAHRIGPRQLETLIAEPLVLLDPEDHVERAMAETYVRITPAAGDGIPGLSDLAYVDACLPLPDALALEQALRVTAHDLLGECPDHDLDERRALALGRLADRAGADAETASRPARQVCLMVHVAQGELKGAGLARVRATNGVEHLVTEESVASWCSQPGTKITVRPVIDLNNPIACPGYAPSDTLRQQVHMLSPTCCFSHCHVPAERGDDDHITPRSRGGATDTWNLAPLCRLHHRVKTFGGWTYTQTTLGTYEWSSPTGHRYRSDRDGTTDLTQRPDPPPLDWS